MTEGTEWIRDENRDVAVLVVNKKIVVHKVKRGQGYICIELGLVDFYCCYISPNIAWKDYTKRVNEIISTIDNNKSEDICRDINAKSPMWGSPINVAKGDYWSQWIAALNMVVHNTGEKATFVRGNTESFIDATFSAQKIAKRIMNWKVEEKENLTEHRYISYEIKTGEAQKRIYEKNKNLHRLGCI